MKKLIPLAFLIFLYGTVIILPILKISFNPALFTGILLLLAIANIYNAFRLNKEEDQQGLRFAMGLTSPGLFPFYIAVFFFFSMLAVGASDENVASLSLLGMSLIGFIRISCAFYGFFYASLCKLSLYHKICPFLPLLNVIDAIYLLTVFHVKHPIENKAKDKLK